MSRLSKLKNRGNSLESLANYTDNLGKKGGGDDRYWKLETDKNDTGSAIIRFIPSGVDIDTHGDDAREYVQTLDFFFKDKGGIYAERCRKSFSGLDYDDDPVCVYRAKLWNTGSEENKEKARKFRMNKSFHTNIYVVSDPANPQNEGKVFLYRFGAELMEKITEALAPEFDGDEKFNPFDLFEGANLRVRARMGANGFRTYDKSEFLKVGAISDTDGKSMSEDQIEALLDQTHSVMEQIDINSKYNKPFDELEAKFNKVIGLGADEDSHREPIPQASAKEELNDEIPDFPSKTQKELPEKEAEAPRSTSTTSDDDDDIADFFANIKG